MTPDRSKIALDVRTRLGIHARAKNINLEIVLVRYVHERLLYRLGQSKYKDRFILKGAMLQTLWLDDPFRPTRDMDLLAFGENDQASLLSIFREILAIESADGIQFELDSLAINDIRLDNEYGGLHVEALSYLGRSPIKVQIDLGFGDAVVPEAREIDFPALLDFPSPRIRAYPQEVVIAEKLHAIVILGRRNSRMKDFYDLWMMSQHFSFDIVPLRSAVAATFSRRQTDLPENIPVGLSEEFVADVTNAKLWTNFISRNILAQSPSSFSDVLADLRTFLMPVIENARGMPSVEAVWEPGGPWRT